MTKAQSLLPVFIVALFFALVWQALVVPMNIRQQLDYAERTGITITPTGFAARASTPIPVLLWNNPDQLLKTYNMDRPRLPSLIQIGTEFWDKSVALAAKGRAWSKRSLFFHGWITLRTTLYCFVLGAAIGVLAAVFVVYSRVFELSFMPWAVTSQIIPIAALAPMIIVLSRQAGILGIELPKSLISAYMCYFPVLVGFARGLREPSKHQIDLFKTYEASRWHELLMLRIPAALPFLFPSLKIGFAGALIGTIVAELPTGAVRGLGARLLIGDQFGNQMLIWASLFTAGLLVGCVYLLIDFIERLVRVDRGQGL